MPGTSDDLSTMPCISIDTPLPSPGWRFRRPGSATTREIVIAPRLLVSTTDSAAHAAIAGVGVVRLLHYQVADALKSGALRIVRAPFETDPTPVHLVHASRGQMPLEMRRFLDFAAPRLEEALQEIGANRSASTRGQRGR